MHIVIKNDTCEPRSNHTIDLFSGIHAIISDIINSMIDEIYSNLDTVVQSFCHWLMYHFKKRKERIVCINMHAIIATLITYPCVTPQNRIFLDISPKLRNVYLLRPRSRGSNDDFNLIILGNT